MKHTTVPHAGKCKILSLVNLMPAADVSVAGLSQEAIIPRAVPDQDLF
jgi:hypothetical protein